MYRLSDYTYTLPPSLIAQEAIHPHHDARLLIVGRESGTIEDESTFWHLDRYIPHDRVLFFNNSRVIPARIRLRNTKIEKINGEKGMIKDGEILFLAKRDETTFEALIRPWKKFDIGTKIWFSKWRYLIVKEKTEEGRLLEAHGDSIEAIMREYGELPLPPYIEYTKEKEDDYQTTFAEKDWSVAAPTASLHFTSELLEKLPHEKQSITLHVGLGTFEPIDTEDIRDYHIHRELVEVPRDIFAHMVQLKMAGKKVLAVGTTALRTLESLPHLWSELSHEEKKKETQSVQDFWNEKTIHIAGGIVKNIKISWNPTWRSRIHEDSQKQEVRGFSESSIFFETEIYIYPGIPFRVVDDLITNFHLSGSSLLVLVGAFLGREKTITLYEHAIREKYRFYSFGDGMYIKS
jgi:S-adenosylmethionine:tRNA ribosyltransferase-isomerase